ncbi:NlpC/P60 family protein [Paenibacillus sp. LMG 31456]|uniref:NlpC/P60 family protein n=1 Tax=Paenibacillus foliorum TaxID=2654974 RepID=A0A972GT96_9BACL|nr:C40 family peptidase [Paenibacillus foliorum]NOU96469.1 NlpC/P60 family protein [Paenibacillus foliorum]
MRKLRLTIGFLCSVALLSGCATPKPKIQQQSVQDDSQRVTEPVSDNKMSDLNVIEHDAELYVGDLGVEQMVSPSKIRTFEKTSNKKNYLLAPNGYPLEQAFPNKAISPIKDSYVENIIETAKTYLGTPYVYGADRMDPSTFDCSSFTRWVYLYSLGMDLPWDSRSQAAYVTAFSKRTYKGLKEARRGDLLFFTRFRGNKASDYAGLDASEKQITHMGIYLGGGKIIHSASKETGGVRIDNIMGKHLEYRLVMGGGVLD